jgi:mRNA-degrading endonuclease toxin of MazEF toxin-antitoxin module
VRPVVVVSRAELNRGTLFLCVPLTSSRVAERRRYANYVFLPRGAGGVRDDSVAIAPHLVQPVRADLLRERWGTVPEATLRRALVAITWSIGFLDA